MNILEKHSISFIFFHFFHFLSLFFLFFFFLFVFLGCSKSSLCLPRLPHDSFESSFGENQFFRPSRCVPHWACYFFLVSTFLFYLNFRFLVQFLSMFFMFFLCFSAFYFMPFISFCPFFFFHFVSLFSFLGCPKSVAALQDSLGKSAHSELAFLLCIVSSSLFPVE